MKYNLDIGFKEGDIVYQVKNPKKYLVRKMAEIEESGSFHDGYEEKHYAYLEDLETQLTEKHQVAFFNLMCQIKNIYFVKGEDQYKEKVN